MPLDIPLPDPLIAHAPPAKPSLIQRLRRIKPLAFAPYLYILPALIILGTFGLLPVLFTFVVSFFRWDAIEGMRAMHFTGLGNYAWVLIDDDWFGHALSGSLWHVAVAGTLVHLTAIPLAVFINNRLIAWRTTVMALYFLPFLTSGMVVYVMMVTVFSGSQNGVANVLFMALGNLEIGGVKPLSLFFTVEPVRWMEVHGAGLWVMASWWHQLGWNVLLYVTALQYIPKNIYEAALIDGANAWQTLRYITIPQLRPMIFFASTLTVVWGLDGVGQYMQFVGFSSGDYGATAAMGVVVLLILAGILYALWAYVGGRPEIPQVAGAPTRQSTPSRVMPWAPWLAWLGRQLSAPAGDSSALRGFNGMRAIACLMVVIHHLTQRLNGDSALIWLVKPLWKLGMNADMGVSVFFVLSGALLSMPFWTQYLAGAAMPSLRHYLFRRAVRILPGYWFALVATVLLGLWLMPNALYVWQRFAAGLSFISGLHYHTLFPSELDPVLWSISFEVLCYLMLPMLLWPAWRLVPSREPLKIARYLVLVLIGLQLAHMWTVATFMTADIDKGWRYGLIGGAKEWIPYWNPATFMTQFMLGAAAALGIAWKTKVNPASSEAFDDFAKWALIAGLILLGLFGGGGVNSITRQPYITPIFPALCAFALFAMHFGLRIHRILDNRLFNFIAKISFGLYLWHFPVIELVRLYWDADYKFMGITNLGHWLLLSGVVVCVSFVLAWLSWIGIERPVLNWAKRRIHKPQSSALAQEVSA